jgi:hypothetical protein
MPLRLPGSSGESKHGNVACLLLLTSVNDRHYWGEALQPKPFELV